MRFLAALFASLTVLTSCGGGGDGPTVSARLPNGSGQVTINMAGNWVVSNARIVETTAPNPTPPVNGTIAGLTSNGILSVDGVLLSRTAIEQALGVPLNWYVNTADGRTLLFGFQRHEDSFLSMFDVTRDGQRFLMLEPTEQASSHLVIVLNWFEELKQRVPTWRQ